MNTKKDRALVFNRPSNHLNLFVLSQVHLDPRRGQFTTVSWNKAILASIVSILKIKDWASLLKNLFLRSRTSMDFLLSNLS